CLRSPTPLLCPYTTPFRARLYSLDMKLNRLLTSPENSEVPPTIASAISEAMSPYSIAVAPLSLSRNFPSIASSPHFRGAHHPNRSEEHTSELQSREKIVRR